MNLRIASLLPFCLYAISVHAQVVHAKRIIVPAYPELPRIVGIQGKVSIEITIKDGRVVEFKSLNGPPQLASSKALRHISDWIFSKDCPESIIVTFDFVLQPYDGSNHFGGTERSTIEITEPNTICITAKRNPPVENNRQY